MSRPFNPTALDLDHAADEAHRRWFVWTAAGLTVHPIIWADRDAAPPAPLVGREEAITQRSLGLRVSRPNSQADVVLYADGWVETAVRRPDAAATVQATAQVDSAEAFGLLLDRVVELITWRGAEAGHRPSRPVVPSRSGRAAHWVLGFDGRPMPIER